MFSKLVKLILVYVTTIFASFGLYAHDIDHVEENVYLGTLSYANGAVFARLVLQFNKGGTLVIAESIQDGSTSFAPFGIQNGYWEKAHDKILIKTVDFTYPKYLTTDSPSGFPAAQQIAVVTGTLNNVDNLLQGELFLTFFPINVANINDPSQATSPASFAGNLTLQLIKRPCD